MKRYFEQFSPAVASVVRDTVRRMSTNTAGGRFALYDDVRVGMSKIWRVDSFAVGLLREDNVVFFPYNFDQGRHLPANFHTYGTNGLAAWLLRNKRAYHYRHDDGAVMRRGHRFGATEKPSRDAVVAPLMARVGGRSKVFGSVAMYSYTSHAFDDQAVAALEWLSLRLAAALRDVLPEVSGAHDVPSYSNLLVDTVERFGADLERVYRAVEDVQRLDGTELESLRRGLADFGARCRDFHVTIMETLANPHVESARAMKLLTPREKEVATLIAHGFSNAEVADKLHMSEATAKTHTSRILRKTGTRQRAELAAKLFPMVQFGGAFHLLDHDG